MWTRGPFQIPSAGSPPVVTGVTFRARHAHYAPTRCERPLLTQNQSSPSRHPVVTRVTTAGAAAGGSEHCPGSSRMGAPRSSVRRSPGL